ncbi:MAG: L-fucose/L-arabinose isomerase family protein [Acidobacteriota bacterium]
MKIGILSFSDSRRRVHESLAPVIEETANLIRQKLEEVGGIKVITGNKIIWRPEDARGEARYLAGEEVDGVILNVPVFAFPSLVRIACQFLRGPFLAFTPCCGKLPGLGGMLAASSGLEQVGIPCEKLYGSLDDKGVIDKMLIFCRAAHAVNRLRGQVLGLIGGRSIGMVTGESAPDLYYSLFGIDVEHIDQLEIVRRSTEIPYKLADEAYNWLESHVKAIEFDAKKLTPPNLKVQIRQYYATKDIIKDRQLDFSAVKCHYELSEYYYTQCLSAAFMNDPYDWEGKKEPFVFSCEADADGAVTMQILKLLSGKPVLFADLRHYDSAHDVYALCNCGAMATWYTMQAEDPSENLKEVCLVPVIEKYSGRGCHVRYIAGQSKVTFARLFRKAGNYHMTIFSGEVVEFPIESLDETCSSWPHLFVKLAVPPDELIPKLNSNHIHGVAGDYVAELNKYCQLKNIQPEIC